MHLLVFVFLLALANIIIGLIFETYVSRRLLREDAEPRLSSGWLAFPEVLFRPKNATSRHQYFQAVCFCGLNAFVIVILLGVQDIS